MAPSPVTPGTASRQAGDDPRLAILLAVLVVLAGGLVLFPQGSSEGAKSAGPPDEPLFTRPYRPTVVAFDAWSDSLWIAGGQAGVLQVDRASGERSLYTHLDGLPSHDVGSILPSEGAVWIASSAGLAAWNRSTEAIESFERTRDGPQGATRLDLDVTALHLEDETLWVGTRGEGLFKLRQGADVLETVPNPVNGSRFEHAIRGIATDGPEIWIGATSYGAVEWHRDTGEAENHDEPLALFTGDEFVGAVAIHGADVWIGTSGEGARRYNRTTDTWQAFANPDNLDAMHVLDIEILGPEIWFATETGISRYNDRTDRWTHWDPENGFPDWRSNDIAVGDGRVWADSRRGVVVFDRGEDRWPRTGLEGLNMPPWTTITDCERRGDELLFATGGGGVGVYDVGAHAWSQPWVWGDYGREGLPDRLIWDVELAGDATWFASQKGLARLVEDAGSWSYYRTDGIEPPNGSTLADRISVVAEANSGIWVGSEGNGLGRYDPDVDRLELYNGTDGLSSDRVLSLAPGPDEVWVGTSMGLDRFDPASGSAERVYPAEGNDTILSMELVGDTLWLGTVDSGLIRLDTRTSAIETVDRIHGPVSLVTAAEGDVWIANRNATLARFEGGERSEEPGRIYDRLETDPPMDVSCVLRVADLVYVGTSWGVHRLDLATDRWLPQQGLPGPHRAPVDLQLIGPQAGTRYQPGDVANVRGELGNATEETIVRARVAQGDWHGANASEGTFHIEIPLPSTQTGKTILHVEVLQENDLLDSRSIPLEVRSASQTDDDEARQAPRLLHDPQLEASTAETINLTARLQPSIENATVVATIQTPNGTTLERQLEPRGDGRYRIDLGPFEQPGDYAYQLAVHDPAGIASLPELGGPFRGAYPLTIHPIQERADLYAPSPALELRGERGETLDFRFIVQNTGTASTTVEVRPSGGTAGWVERLASEATVNASASRVVEGTVSIPEDASPGTYQLQIELVPLDGVPEPLGLELTIHVEADGGADPSPIPTLAPWWAMVAVGLAAFGLGRSVIDEI